MNCILIQFNIKIIKLTFSNVNIRKTIILKLKKVNKVINE